MKHQFLFPQVLVLHFSSIYLISIHVVSVELTPQLQDIHAIGLVNQKIIVFKDKHGWTCSWGNASCPIDRLSYLYFEPLKIKTRATNLMPVGYKLDFLEVFILSPWTFDTIRKLTKNQLWVLSHVPFFEIPWTAAHQAPLSMGFSMQEYWNGLPFPPPGDLPIPGTEPTSPVSPALQADSLLLSHLASPQSPQREEQNLMVENEFW